jgi:hypothetical protein
MWSLTQYCVHYTHYLGTLCVPLLVARSLWHWSLNKTSTGICAVCNSCSAYKLRLINFICPCNNEGAIICSRHRLADAGYSKQSEEPSLTTNSCMDRAQNDSDSPPKSPSSTIMLLPCTSREWVSHLPSLNRARVHTPISAVVRNWPWNSCAPEVPTAWRVILSCSNMAVRMKYLQSRSYVSAKPI